MFLYQGMYTKYLSNPYRWVTNHKQLVELTQNDPSKKLILLKIQSAVEKYTHFQEKKKKLMDLQTGKMTFRMLALEFFIKCMK